MRLLLATAALLILPGPSLAGEYDPPTVDELVVELERVIDRMIESRRKEIIQRRDSAEAFYLSLQAEAKRQRRKAPPKPGQFPGLNQAHDAMQDAKFQAKDELSELDQIERGVRPIPTGWIVWPGMPRDQATGFGF